MIDSHCHLDHEPLISDLSNVIQRSKDVGIKKLLTISTSIDSFSKIKQLIHKDDIIYGTVGIHPHESDKNVLTSSQLVQNFTENEKIIGIGETGLDFYYNNSDREKQISSFKEHIEASIETKSPLIVHSRNAEKETYEILSSYKNNDLKILMHCFTGSKEFSKNITQRAKADDNNLDHVGSPLPGQVAKIFVQSGSKVIKGDKLLVIEAMKMETTINADKSGTIKSINVASGDNVETKDLLVEIS